MRLPTLVTNENNSNFSFAGGALSFVVTQRIQAWDFSSYKIPDISDSKLSIFYEIL